MKHAKSRSVPLLLVVSLCASPLLAQEKAAHWPQFRGPDGMGTSERPVPVKWGPDENIAWKTELPGPGTSSPVIYGNRIFLTCYTGYMVPGQRNGSIDNLRLHVLCIDRQSGKILWNKTIQPKLPEQESIREEHGYASSTPVVDDERVYVFFGRTGVFAFDHQGKQLWQADVGGKTNGWGSGASPVLFGDLVIINASVESESLVALDRKTGEEKWRAGGIRESWNTPFILSLPGGRHEVIVPIVRKILSFDPESGERLWTCDTGIGWYMVPSVVADDGIVYCTGGRSNDALAVRGGGRGDVTRSHTVWHAKKGSNVTSPIFHDGCLYWMNDNLGIAYCADGKTGEIIYDERLSGADQVYASPVLAGGKLYYQSRSGRMFVLAAQPQFKVLAVNTLENRGRFDASPAIAEGQLFIRSNRYLYCIGKRSE